VVLYASLQKKLARNNVRHCTWQASAFPLACLELARHNVYSCCHRRTAKTHAQSECITTLYKKGCINHALLAQSTLHEILGPRSPETITADMCTTLPALPAQCLCSSTLAPRSTVYCLELLQRYICVRTTCSNQSMWN